MVLTLQEILEQQRDIQDIVETKLDRPAWNELTARETADLIKHHVTHMMVECGEFLQELPYFKYWRTYPEYDRLSDMPSEQWHALCIEYIDIFIFHMNLGLLLGLDAEAISQLYQEKTAINRKRIIEGY